MTVHTKKIIIFSSISFLSAILISALIIIPFLKSIYNIFGEIIEVKKDLVSFEQEELKSDIFEKEYNNFEITPEKINDYLVSESAPIDLIRFFEDTARDSGLAINISPTSVLKSAKDPWQSIGFSIELTGSFASSMRFLEKVENSRYFIQINRFSAKILTQKDISFEKYLGLTPGQMVITIDLKAYTKQ